VGLLRDRIDTRHLAWANRAAGALLILAGLLAAVTVPW